MTISLIAEDRASRLADAAVAALDQTRPVTPGTALRLGLDLGTASIICAVLDATNQPVATAMQQCQVARDGLVVDYLGAIDITRRLVDKLQRRLGRDLTNAAIAVPPGTNRADSSAHRHVAEAAGLEVTAVLDEPTAAGNVLGVDHGAVVDVGGGTTGVAVFRDGQVTYVADEPTGGTHMTLVLAGRLGLDYDQAEAFKQDPANREVVRAAVLPVAQKMAGIVAKHIEGKGVDRVYLVGGACGVKDMELVFEDVTGVPTAKPSSPMMITPLGIAMGATAG
jgi:ethanolamine utilization protein EutJ